MKICSKCGEEKAEREFYFINYVRKDGTRKRRNDCKQCCHQGDKERYFANREKYNATKKDYRTRNRKHIAELIRDWKRENRFANALISSREHAKKRGYVACSAMKDALEKAFTGNCHVCAQPEGVKIAERLCLDHNHKTGEFRGWLCHRCNRLLGLAGDSPDRLIALAAYLNIQQQTK